MTYYLRGARDEGVDGEPGNRNRNNNKKNRNKFQIALNAPKNERKLITN